MRRPGFLTRIINFITFVDLPIRKKFILFAIGVLFWFLTMFVISISTLMYIHTKSASIVNEAVPHDRIAQKITRKLLYLTIDSEIIGHSNDFSAVAAAVDRSKKRIEDIRYFTTALAVGGQVNDLHREDDRLIETLDLEPISGKDRESRTDLEKLNETIAKLTEVIGILGKNRIAGFGGELRSGVSFPQALEEYRQSIDDATTIAGELSVHTSTSYAVTSRGISRALQCTTIAASVVLIVSMSLLALFTFWISRSIANPVKSIIQQIRALGEGEVDLTKRIEINSKDEIGTLSKDFNDLMEEIHAMATFKKVIEEDEILEDVYARLGKVFSDNFGLHDFVIYEVSNSQNKMKTVYPLITDEKEIFCNEDILANCNLCRAKKTGHTVSSVEFPGICKQFKPETGRRHICIPMIIGGSTGGVVQFLFDEKHSYADSRDHRVYKSEQYIKEALSVIEAKRLMNTLRESALKDSLTGLYNRRFLQEYTETLVAGIQRRGKNIGLIMCDLDYFKQVNDVYGHSIGDILLKETSQILKKSVRESDLVIRFGGEEFLIILLDINDGDAMSVAEKIRGNIEAAKIKVQDGILQKTISLGVSEFPRDTQGFWQAIKFADVALYRAKETGRNRAVRFISDMWTEERF